MRFFTKSPFQQVTFSQTQSRIPFTSAYCAELGPYCAFTAFLIAFISARFQPVPGIARQVDRGRAGSAILSQT